MTPGAAIGWELLRRHRLGLASLLAYFVAAAAYKTWMLGTGRAFTMEEVEYFVFGAAVPLGTAIMYLLAVFTFGLSGDFGGRPSIYPARLFTLPVTSTALAGWPMVYGAIGMTLVWAGLRVVALWPEHEHIPVIWPAMLGVVFLGWTQALTWLPYGLAGLRVVVLLLALTVVEVVVLVGLHFRISEGVMIAILAPAVPPAFLVARAAVSRARRGDVPDWSEMVTRRAAATRRLAPFPSPERAQAWLEWQRGGWSLPVLVAILLPFELAVLLVAANAMSLILTILLCVLVTPPFLATFTAATVRAAGSNLSDSYSVSPFIATRPLTSAALIAAKLRMTARSTLVTWAIVIIAVPLGLVWTGSWAFVSERARYFADYWGANRAIALALVILIVFALSTWRQMVQSLFIGLSGREWIVRWSVGISMVLLSLAAPLVIWVTETPAAKIFLFHNVERILAALALIKMALAAWVAVGLWRSRVVSDRTLLVGAATWLAAVLFFYGVLSWLFYSPQIPRSLFAVAAILIVPLVRLAAAPLALDRNRHG